MVELDGNTAGELKRQRVCARSGCDRRAVYLAGLIVRTGESDRGMQTVLDIPTCPACAKRLRIVDVLTDAGWDRIVAGMAKLDLKPVRRLTRLFTCPIDEAPKVFRDRYERKV